MEFPFKFRCQLKNKGQTNYEECECILLPLVLHLETATKKSQLHLLRLTFNSQQINDQNLLFLYKESECLILKLKDEIDYKVSVCMLETLIPEKDGSLWKKQQEIEVLSTENCVLYSFENRSNKGRYIGRSIKLYKSTNEELEIIRNMANRCVMKPDHMYRDGSHLRLVYKSFSGCILKRFLKKKKLPPQQDLRLFVSKMIFLLQQFEAKNIIFSGLKEDVVFLLDQKLSSPAIIDLSSAEYNENSKTYNKHLVSLGQLLFRIVQMKSPETGGQLNRLKKYLSGQIGPFCQSLIIYSKTLFQMACDMITPMNGKICLEGLSRHRWFLEKCNYKLSRDKKLGTIMSINYTETDIQEDRNLESDYLLENKEVGQTHTLIDYNSNEYLQGEKTLCTKLQQMHRFHVKPFRFMF